MGFPPPSNNGPQPPEQGGGFGPPPQGFGPPPPPGDGYGYPQQGGGYGPPATPGPPAPPGGGFGQPGDGGFGQGGYGQGGGGFGQPGGFGPGGFPPPPPPNNTKRNVWIAVGTVVVVGAIIAGVVVANNGGDDKEPTAKHSISMPSTAHMPSDLDIPTDFPSLDLPTDLPSDDSGGSDDSGDSGDTDEPSSTPTDKEVPYVSVSPGKCFNAPSMTHTLDKVTVVDCSSPHDAQSIANKTLTGAFTDDQEIEDKAFDLCKADAKAHVPSDGKEYYEYVLYPQLITYELQKRDTITCALSVNDGTNNKKLTGKLG